MSDINIEFGNYDNIDYYYYSNFDFVPIIDISKSANYKFDITNLDNRTHIIQINIQTLDYVKINIINSFKENHLYNFIIKNDIIKNDIIENINNKLPSTELIFNNIKGDTFKGPSIFSYTFNNCNWDSIKIYY